MSAHPADDEPGVLVMLGRIELAPDVDEGRREQALRLMRETARASRAEAGNRSYAFTADLEDRHVFHFAEVWDDEAALQAHIAQPHADRFVQELPGLGLVGVAVTQYRSDAGRALPPPF